MFKDKRIPTQTNFSNIYRLKRCSPLKLTFLLFCATCRMHVALTLQIMTFV